MSLVNDMLRDLEKRGQGRKTASDAVPVQSVQPLTAEQASRTFNWPLWLVFAALVVGFLALAWMQWRPAPEVVVKVEQPAIVTPAAEITATAKPPARHELRLEQVRWRKADQGGVLVMRFNAQPQVQLINQTRTSMVIALPDAQLTNTLPLPEKTVVSEFNLMADKGQLLLDLKAVRDARFELLRPDSRQVELAVWLSEPDTKPAKADTPVEPVLEKKLRVADKPERKAKPEPVQVAVVATEAKPEPKSQSPEEPAQKAVSPKTSAKTPKNELLQTARARDASESSKKIRGLTDAQAVAKARKLLQQNKVTEAQLLLESQLDRDKQSLDSRALLASLYLAGGNIAQASDVADVGLAAAPIHSGLKKVKARILLMNKDSAAAVALLQSAPPAIKLDAEYHELLAAALQQQGRADDAVNVYYQLLKYDSGQARLWVGLGYSLELAARPAESRKAYESSLQVPGIEDNLKRYVTQRLSQLAER
ncbi:tetratricopeptide repeat protein [Pontibacterium sp.]|uniref:tetratricopeptide repeat protein n=1 Tax=Pontibacterium sp. TaxID=2036026 RepID=UPI0035141581